MTLWSTSCTSGCCSRKACTSLGNRYRIVELPAGTWVPVLDSLPQGSVSAEQAIARPAELSRPGHTAIVIDTNRFEGLNANYWAVVIPGAESRAASNAVCEAIGLPVGNNCYPREIKG